MKTNELAKRGVPSLAIADTGVMPDYMEGFDNEGNYWYRAHTSAMRPMIENGSYLCLRKLKSTNDIFGFNGEAYVLAIRDGDTTTVVLGHVVNDVRKDDFVRVLTTFPQKCRTDIPKGIIVEQYVVTGVLKQLPTKWNV